MANMAEAAGFPAPFTSHTNKESQTKTAVHHGRMPLLHAPVDTYLRVVSFGTSKGVALRLSSMGVTENSIIQVMHQAGGNLIIAVENTRLAIEPSIAHRVIVVPVAD